MGKNYLLTNIIINYWSFITQVISNSKKYLVIQVVTNLFR